MGDEFIEGEHGASKILLFGRVSEGVYAPITVDANGNIVGIGAVDAAAVAQGAAGSLTAKLRRLTTDLNATLTRIGTVTESPTAYTLLSRLKAVATALDALGYEFTINGINFNGYAKLKSLTLDTGAYNDHPYTLHDAGVDYEVPASKAFIAFQVTAWNQQIAMLGRIGESDSADAVITKEVLKLGNGTLLPFMTACYGVFTAGKFVTAESDSGSSNYCLKSGTVLYGAEIDV